MTSAKSVPASERRTIANVRVGIIGAGMIGEDHARRLTHTVAGATVTAITDVDAARACDVANALPAARVYENCSDLIAADDVDAVLVASWGPVHEEHVLAAVAVGKPVFCEKPLAPHADACLRIIAAEIQHGRRLVQVGFMRRYDDGYRAMKAAFARGVIGPALMVHNKHRNPSVPPRGFTSDMPITDSAIHELDLTRWLLEEEIVAVRVMTSRRTSLAAEGVQDPQFIVLESQSGVHIDIEVFVNCTYGYDIACELVGETGTLSLADPGGIAVRLQGSRSESVASGWRERFVRAYDIELQEWIKAVAAGTTVGPSSWDGYAAAVVGEACLDSLHSGERAIVNMADRPAFYG